MDTTISTIKQLEIWLDVTPVIAGKIEILSLAFLSFEPEIYFSCADMVRFLDKVETVETDQKIICLEIDQHYAQRFPIIECHHNPYTEELNTILSPKYEFIRNSMLGQDQISDVILQDCLNQEIDAVVLILVDGLSYSDVADWRGFSCMPCFVPGLTNTSEGFQNVIGRKMPLAVRLFDLGFKNRIGYTYWQRQTNELTDILFRTVHRMQSVNSMAEVFEHLRVGELKKSYIQIVRAGLDQYAHSCLREDLVQKRRVTLKQIRSDLNTIASIFNDKGLKAFIYAISDHGILWRDKTQLEEIDSGFGKSSPRYYGVDERAKFPEDKGRYVRVNELTYFQLDYPYIRRRLHRNEWGVHGGLSFQESIVPFIKIDTSLWAK
ncbi:MAG: hypothetical protein ACE5PV_17725 [Candidatus Poribacteria bacterium]